MFTANEISESNGEYFIDENGDGLADYSFSNPDFNFIEFRSNLVLRWEYKPGSEFYVVWTRGNRPDAFGDLDTPLGQSLYSNAFAEHARNIFLIKVTYRFLR